MGGLVTYSGSQLLTGGTALTLVTNVAATGRVVSGFTSAVAERRKLDHVTLEASEAITETVTLTLNSRKGSTYDIPLDASSMAAETMYQYVPLSPVYLGPGDNLTLTCTAAGTTGTVYAAIVCEE